MQYHFVNVINIRISRHYFSCRRSGTSLILKAKESPTAVTQTHPLFRLAIPNVWYIEKLSVFQQNVVFSLKTDKNLLFLRSRRQVPTFYLIWQLTIKQESYHYPRCTFHMDDGLMFCSWCNIVKNIQSWLKESPLMFNYCLLGRKTVLLCSS